jgi:hypothetical protein
MGRFAFLFFPWGIILQAAALVHFIRRRPDNYWLWVILLFGPMGALVYLLVEAAPDLGLLRNGLKMFPRRRRIRELQVIVTQNPAPGNYEELADLYFEDGRYAQARQCYDRAITARSDSLDPFYRRGLCAYQMKDYPAAIADLQFVTGKKFGYDFQRAAGLLADCFARTGQADKADPLFKHLLQTSSSTEIQCNYAEFLAAQSRNSEARELVEHILSKRPLMTRFQKRLERPWLRRAAGLRKRLPAATASTAV